MYRHGLINRDITNTPFCILHFLIAVKWTRQQLFAGIHLPTTPQHLLSCSSSRHWRRAAYSTGARGVPPCKPPRAQSPTTNRSPAKQPRNPKSCSLSARPTSNHSPHVVRALPHLFVHLSQDSYINTPRRHQLKTTKNRTKRCTRSSWEPLSAAYLLKSRAQDM